MVFELWLAQEPVRTQGDRFGLGLHGFLIVVIRRRTSPGFLPFLEPNLGHLLRLDAAAADRVLDHDGGGGAAVVSEGVDRVGVGAVDEEAPELAVGRRGHVVGYPRHLKAETLTLTQKLLGSSGHDE